MAKIEIKESKDTVSVQVSVPALPPKAKDAKELKESLTRQQVCDHIKAKGIKIGALVSGPHSVSNLSGRSQTGTFVFKRESPPATKKVLTPETKHVIIPEATRSWVEPMLGDKHPPASPPASEAGEEISKPPRRRRKRVSRASKTTNSTTS